MLFFLKRYWFLLCLAVVVFFGFTCPGPGLAYRDLGAVPLSVAFLMFLSGLLLDTSSLVREITNFRLLGAVFACVFAAFPLLACATARVFFPGEEDVLIALVILAAQPSTLASAIVMTRIAEGNEALAVVAAVTTNLSSVLLTPLIFFLVLGAGGQVEISTKDMIWRLLRIVLLPVAIGQAFRPLVSKKHLEFLRKPSGVISQLVILGMILTGVSGASGHLTGALQLVVVSFCLHIAMLAVTSLSGRILGASRGERVALTLCGSQKTLPAGIYIWSTYFHYIPIGSVPLVAYHVVQMIVDSILAVRLRDRTRAM
ncbi:MAG: bile acid:sodium symporter [bacterium]